MSVNAACRVPSALLRRPQGLAHLHRLRGKLVQAMREAGFTGPEVEVSGQSLAPPPPAFAESADLALGCFHIAKAVGKSPADVASAVSSRLTVDIEGEKALEGEEALEGPLLSAAQAVGPYVNLRLRLAPMARAAVCDVLDQGGGEAVTTASHRLIEFSSPNTNKPQHLGHVRNNLLGDSMRRLWLASGHRVTAVNLINDRGIHICKSMVAYRHWGNGGQPADAGVKGDHYVGKFYTMFEQEFTNEYKAWLESETAQEHFTEWKSSAAGHRLIERLGGKTAKKKKKGKDAGGENHSATGGEPQEADVWQAFVGGYKDSYFNGPSALGAECRTMLQEWEQGENVAPQVWELWRRLNGWVLDGFAATYKNFGVAFDHLDFESVTYLQGKEVVQAALQQGILRIAPDGSTVWDVPQAVHVGNKAGGKGKKRKKGEDPTLQGSVAEEAYSKVLLRADGTSVYMTQDLGTAVGRYSQHAPDHMTYVVADEQDRHFRILFSLLGQVRPELDGQCSHLSYGLVNLPSGRMKSREGTVVDADELLLEAEGLAADATRAKWPELSEEEVASRARCIGLAAIKFFMLGHPPATTFVYEASRALDFSGRTGPYCLYTYARTRSILRKEVSRSLQSAELPQRAEGQQLDCLRTLSTKEERAVVAQLLALPIAVQAAVQQQDPSKVAGAVYDLSRAFNTMYFDREKHAFSNCSHPELKEARLILAEAVGSGIAQGLDLLGIETLEQM